MTEFLSEERTTPHSEESVFRVISDLSNLAHVEEFLPMDSISGFSFDEDTVSFRVDPVGKVAFRVSERIPNKLIKFQSQQLPFDVLLWIHLDGKSESETQLLVRVSADLNPFIKGMVEKQMQEIVDKISEGLSQLPYSRL